MILVILVTVCFGLFAISLYNNIKTINGTIEELRQDLTEIQLETVYYRLLFSEKNKECKALKQKLENTK